MKKAIIGCVVNHDDKVITVTKAFDGQASIPGTKEFRHLTQLHKNFPDYDIVRRTATVKESKEKHNGLTIAMMEKIITCQPNGEALMKEYHEFVEFYGKESTDKKTGEKTIRAPYGKVKGWFLKKVPNYKDIDIFQPIASAESND